MGGKNFFHSASLQPVTRNIDDIIGFGHDGYIRRHR